MRLAPLLLGLCWLTACSEGDDAALSPDRGDADGNTGGATSDPGGAASDTGGAGGAGGAEAAPRCPDPIDLGVRMVGRHDGCDASGVRFRWSGAGFVARFSGTGASVIFDDEPNEYTVVIDGAVGDKLVTTSGLETYVVATGLEAGEHTLELYRRTEASFGASLLVGVEIEGGALIDPPPPPARRIEVIGDSISCGYGVEGADTSCGFSADTENHYLTYGAVLARSFDAELATIAWSGKGVVSNYNGNRVLPLPAVYDWAVDNSADWDFSWQPQAVVINLGTNDFSTDADPSHEEFIAGYVSFLEHLRAAYPEAEIFCTVGPMLTGSTLTRTRDDIAAAVAERNDGGDDHVRTVPIETPNEEPGCDWHPNPATQAAMAAELEAALSAVLGW